MVLGDVVLSVEAATVRVSGTTILDSAELELSAGEVTVIVGPNGAGKSTLLSVASGERKPSEGSVSLMGRDISRIGVRQLARERAFMPQDAAVAFPFTVGEVVSMGRTAWGDTAATTTDVVAGALEMTGLVSLADRAVTTLSGGERQLVAFARVIAQATPVSEGSVVLLDEPTSAMDISHAETTLSMARDLASDGAAVGIVLHDLDAAAAYADKVVIMDSGRVRDVGPVDRVFDSEILSDVYNTPIEVFCHDGRLRVAPERKVAGITA